jgi:hypothetical protein
VQHEIVPRRVQKTSTGNSYYLETHGPPMCPSRSHQATVTVTDAVMVLQKFMDGWTETQRRQRGVRGKRERVSQLVRMSENE